MYKTYRFRLTMVSIVLILSFLFPWTANAKNNNVISGGTISNTITTEEITSVLTNYSNYLPSNTTGLIDPTVSQLLVERKSFYNDLFETGLNSKLKSINSEFNIEMMDVAKSDNGYSIKIVETVTLAGKYKLAKVADYPIIKASQWATQHTTDTKAINALQSFIERQTQDVEERMKNGEDFETSLIINHRILVAKVGTRLRIMSDIFDDKAPLDPAGIDVVSWTEDNLQRTKPDLTLMPDYHINRTAINVLGQEILNSFTTTKPEPTPVGRALNPTSSLVLYHIQGQPAPAVRPLFTYSHTAAKNYINTWTSAATGSCPGYPTMHWDPTKYNNAQYSLFTCNDCTNYVSQALRAGGIPTTADWAPYTYDWVNVTGLLDYLATNGIGTDNQACNAAGDLAYLPDKSHIVMIGAINPLRYSGHTNDRLLYTWNSSFVCMHIN